MVRELEQPAAAIDEALRPAPVLGAAHSFASVEEKISSIVLERPSPRTWWAVILFGFFAALTQLGVAVALINSIVTGFVAMLAIAGGLAFGLGGKEYAASLINKLREHTER